MLSSLFRENIKTVQYREVGTKFTFAKIGRKLLRGLFPVRQTSYLVPFNVNIGRKVQRSRNYKRTLEANVYRRIRQRFCPVPLSVAVFLETESKMPLPDDGCVVTVSLEMASYSWAIRFN